jgi:hypothetical protein
MNYYHTSSGERISKIEINRRIHESKRLKLEQQKNEFGYNFCDYNEDVNCNPDENCHILDCMHIESVDLCQKNGYCEKAWDIDNIRIIGRKCHRIHDKTNLKFKSNDSKV